MSNFRNPVDQLSWKLKQRLPSLIAELAAQIENDHAD
jgi:hypothetical protein